MTDGSQHATSQVGTENEGAGTRSSSTDRVRLHRARRRDGLTPITVELYDHEVTDLVTYGLLSSGERTDRAAIGRAVGRVLDLAVPALKAGRLRTV